MLSAVLWQSFETFRRMFAYHLPPNRKKRQAALQVEVLEGRNLLDNNLWQPRGASEVWSDGRNWSLGRAPIAADTLVFAGPMNSCTATAADLPTGTTFTGISMVGYTGTLTLGAGITIQDTQNPQNQTQSTLSGGTIAAPNGGTTSITFKSPLMLTKAVFDQAALINTPGNMLTITGTPADVISFTLANFDDQGIVNWIGANQININQAQILADGTWGTIYIGASPLPNVPGPGGGGTITDTTPAGVPPNFQSGQPNGSFLGSTVGGLIEQNAGATTVNAWYHGNGTLQVNGGTIAFQQPARQDNGSTQLNGGTISAAQEFWIYNGALTGNGTVNGSVVAQTSSSTGAVQTIRPSLQNAGGGVITINGDLVLRSTAVVIIGTSATGATGAINVSGNVNLANATLRVSRDANDRPGAPTVRPFLTGTITPDFGTKDYEEGAPNLWDSADGTQTGLSFAARLSSNPTVYSLIVLRPPMAQNDNGNVHKQPVNIAVLTNDSDYNDTFYGLSPSAGSSSFPTVTITAAPSYGTATVNTDNTVTYTPGSGFASAGSDSFQYTITDSYGETSQPATVTLTLVNQAPIALNDSYQTQQDQTLSTAAPGVLSNDKDPDGDTLAISAVNGSAGNVGIPITLSSGSTLTLNADGSFTYVPGAGFSGDDSFTYTASDGCGGMSSATVTITVLATQYSIGRRMWWDYNHNGIQDTSEVYGPSGMTVKLLDASGNLVATTTTDSVGSYGFIKLAAGSYTIQFAIPTGAQVSPPHQGTNTDADSDALPNGMTGPIILENGQSQTHIDAGVYFPGTGAAVAILGAASSDLGSGTGIGSGPGSQVPVSSAGGTGVLEGAGQVPAAGMPAKAPPPRAVVPSALPGSSVQNARPGLSDALVGSSIGDVPEHEVGAGSGPGSASGTGLEQAQIELLELAYGDGSAPGSLVDSFPRSKAGRTV